MRAYIGVTDYDWFNILRQIHEIEEVNFWQPGGKQIFKALLPGELFLFKLHARDGGKIVGGGVFAYSKILPINLVWDTFEIKNGAISLQEMRKRLQKYRHQNEDPFANYDIGCILIKKPFFLPEGQWINVPDWKSPIVQGKTYDLSIEPGRSIINQLHVNSPIAMLEQEQPVFPGVSEPQARYGEPIPVLPRLGQGIFRIQVTEAYDRRCAVTNERTLPALDAAHIKPYADDGLHTVNNGILLRRDLHALFDKGYVTVNPSMVFEVSRKIKEEYENGRDYYRLHGTQIRLPVNPLNRPSKEYIEWHNTKIYRG